MSDEDARRWDARHARADDTGPQPPELIRGREALLPEGGRVLDVGCGRGSVARWFAEGGFAVDAVDVSPVAIEAARSSSERADSAARSSAEVDGADGITWWLADLDDGLPAGCTGPYDVVVCQRFRDPALWPVLREVLAPGGLLLVTVLSEVEAEPGSFRAPRGELTSAFAGLDVLVASERDGLASLIARG